MEYRRRRPSFLPLLAPGGPCFEVLKARRTKGRIMSDRHLRPGLEAETEFYVQREKGLNDAVRQNSCVGAVALPQAPPAPILSEGAPKEAANSAGQDHGATLHVYQRRESGSLHQAREALPAGATAQSDCVRRFLLESLSRHGVAEATVCGDRFIWVQAVCGIIPQRMTDVLASLLRSSISPK